VEEPVKKAWPCVLRRAAEGWSVLAFLHPLLGLQLPKGTVEDGEPIESAVLRELEEESGIADGRIRSFIEKLDWTGDDGAREEWHLYEVDVGPCPDRWTHRPTGGGEESEHLFEFFWHPLDGDLEGIYPVFVSAIEAVRRHTAGRS
jgi:8-oxo-dGTP pyrophosphatase MutT (NUDIX family)